MPLRERLVRNRGNRSQLKAASCLIRLFRRWAGQGRMRRVLLDAWTMKGPLVKRILADGCAVIGREPGHGGHRCVPETSTPQRGRPPTYGPTLTWEVVTNRSARQEVSIQT